MPSTTPCLWFDGQAEQAAAHYVSIFPHSEVLGVSRYGPEPDAAVMTVEFSLDGTRYTALNGGPQYVFTEAISFQIPCDGQEEVDYYWDRLTDGGEEGQCAWLKDRFGVSWQVIPRQLMEYLGDPDPARAQRAMQAMRQMRKIDIEGLRRAADAAAI